MPSFDAQQTLGAVERAQALTREYFNAFADIHDWIADELPFCADLDQYDDDEGNEKSIERIQPRDQAIFHLWVYKRAMALKRAPIHIECEPVDEQDDPQAAEDMKHVLEWELLRNRLGGFKRVRRRYVGGALMGRAWGAAVDYDPERDMLKYRDVDPRNLAFTPGFIDPHDPDCPVLIERVRMYIEDARRMPGWKNADKLMPDEGDGPTGRSGRNSDPPGSVDFTARSVPDVRATETPSFVTIAKVWYRVDPDGKSKAKERELMPGERYMTCTGCGYKSAPEGQAGAFPERVPGACPTCEGELRRVDAIEDDEAGPDGLLVIVPMNQPWSYPALYSGEWPVDCPTFPYLWLVAYDVPHKAIGPSDISQNWTVALTKNATIRMIWEQSVRSKAHPLLPEGGIVDYRGMPYEFLPDNGDVMYYNRNMPPQGVSMVQATPVSSALFQLLDKLESVYKRYEGTSDVAITPGETRDIAASSLEQQIETGNVPVDDFIELLYDAESIFFTIVAYYARATYGAGKMVRWFGDNGKLMYARMRGGALPSVDVSVSAGPTLDNVKAEKVDAYMKLVSTPPQYRRGLARFLRFDPSVVQQIEADDEQFKQQDPEVQQAVQSIKMRRFAGAQMSPAGPPQGNPSPNGTPQGVMQ